MVNRSIDRPGELIVACGLSGSGKSTLARHAIRELGGSLKYINTTTTRPRRANEDDLEYTFVDKREYDSSKLQSKNWDESIVYGNYYGADADSYINQIEQGQNFIVCSTPSNEIISEMGGIYTRERITTLHLLTHQNTSIEHMRHRDAKVDMARVAMDLTMMQEMFVADYTIRPSGSLDVDKERFINLIRRIIT